MTITVNDVVTTSWNALTNEGNQAITELAVRYLPHLQSTDRGFARSQAWRFMVDFNALSKKESCIDADIFVKEVLSEVFDFVYESTNHEISMEKINELFWEAYDLLLKQD